MSGILIRPSKAKPIFLATLAGAALSAAAGVLSFGSSHAGEWFATSALFLGGAGTVSSAVRSYYSATAEVYGDDEKFPYGPPSPITRELFVFHEGDGSVVDRIAQIAIGDHAPAVFYALTFIVGIPAIWF